MADNVLQLELDQLIEELDKSKRASYSIPTKISKTKSGTKCKNCIHKYIRFRRTNKTFKHNIYYCTKCPSTVTIDRIFGRTIICWKCDKPFTAGANDLLHKPTCKECR